MALPQLPKLEMTVQFRSPAPTHYSQLLTVNSFHTIVSLPRRGLASLVNPFYVDKTTRRGNFDESTASLPFSCRDPIKSTQSHQPSRNTASSAWSHRSDNKKPQQGERRWYSVCQCQILLHVGNRLEVARVSRPNLSITRFRLNL